MKVSAVVRGEAIEQIQSWNETNARGGMLRQ